MYDWKSGHITCVIYEESKDGEKGTVDYISQLYSLSDGGESFR